MLNRNKKAHFYVLIIYKFVFMIVNPNLTTHTIKLVPRYSPTISLFLTITDSTLGVSEIVTTTYTTGGDYKLALTFEYTFRDENSYQLTLKEVGVFPPINEIVYRGLVLATTQNSQTYKLTDNLYRW